MIALICYFFPAVVALWLYEVLTKNELGLKKCLYRFCGNALAINMFCFAIKKFILHTADSPMLYGATEILPAVALNYMLMASCVAIGIVLIEVLFSKRVKISVEEASVEETRDVIDGENE